MTGFAPHIRNMAVAHLRQMLQRIKNSESMRKSTISAMAVVARKRGGKTYFGPLREPCHSAFVGMCQRTSTEHCSGDGTLVLFDFTALGSGTSPLTISNATLLDSNLTLTCTAKSG